MTDAWRIFVVLDLTTMNQPSPVMAETIAGNASQNHPQVNCSPVHVAGYENITHRTLRCAAPWTIEI
jgi:hypothetical protein